MSDLSNTIARSRKVSLLLWLMLVAAGLAGNYFKFPLFLDIDFLFGSIFAMLALQFFGLGRGILAAALIASYTYFLWNHPYAVVIMTAEVAVVGWLVQRRKLGLVLADALYWLVLGIPLVFVLYRFVMQASLETTEVTMVKQAVNGIANTLVARLIFIGLALRSGEARFSFRELIYNLMAFFVLFPTLIMLTVGGRTDFHNVDVRIRASLTQEKRVAAELLSTWLSNRRSSLVNLAQLAAAQTARQMQVHLAQALQSDRNFQRIGLLDKDAVSTAFFPLFDELGQINVGKNFADRSFVPALKQTLRPVLSEIFMSRIGKPKPVVLVAAPVLTQGNYDGFTSGVLSLEQIEHQLSQLAGGEGMLYTVLDKGGKVIMTNRSDQTVMQAFARGRGAMNGLDAEVSQWVPNAVANKPVAERWKSSLYVVESDMGDFADWRLLLEQPLAPFQKLLFDNYTNQLTLLFLLLLASLVLAEILSRGTVQALDQLSNISRELAHRPEAFRQDVAWPRSSISQTWQLVESFRAMSESLTRQFQEIRQSRATLETRVQERTQELQHSNSLLQGILDNIPVGLSAFDGELNLVAHNRLFRVNLGLPDSLFDGRGTRFESIISHNAEQGEYGEGDRAQLVQSIVERASHPQSHQFERVRPNGTVLEIRGAPLPGGGFVTTYADITERKRIEAENQRSAQLLRGAIESIDEAFVLYDADDRLVFCNEKYRQIYDNIAHLMVPGVQFETLLRVGAEGGQYSDAIGRVDEWMAERLAAHRASNSTLIQRHTNGRTLRIVERKLPDGHIVGFRIDITDLVNATQDAQAANIAKSRFLATMSHEIRTPMNGILGMAQLLLMPGLTEAERRDYARTILSAGESLLTLLNDILDLSKIEAGKFELEATVFDPLAVLNETKTLFLGAAQAKDLQIECEWSGAKEQRYLADSHRLRQMLSNLVGNAVKFTQTGQIRVEAREIERAGTSVLLECSVRDSGMGIPPDKIDLLFKPFSQADSSTTRQYGGSGLGLSIVSHLAQAMGGHVGVESVPGQGSRFWFRVRCEVLADGEDARRVERVPAIGSARAEVAATALSGNVLVVEDNPVNRMFIKALLGKLGLHVVMAHDGQQAVDRVTHGGAPDLALMDLNMPVMDGYTATQRIRQWEREGGRARLPIIALTADAFEEDRQHCLAVGMDDFLTKPVAVHALKSTLLKWLPQAHQGALEIPALEPVKPLDRRQFAALLAEMEPLLEKNKFDAIHSFRKLQALAEGTPIAARIKEMDSLLRLLRFDQALERLRAIAAEQTEKDPS